MVYGKTAPNALEIEDAVIGVMMMEKGAVDDVSMILGPESFYSEVNQKICRAIYRLAQWTKPTDIISVVQELREMGELENIGGPFIVTKKTNSVVSSASLEYHCRIIQEKFIQREMIRIAGQIVNDAYQDGTDVFKLLDHAEEEFLKIGSQNVHGEVRSIDTVLMKTMERIEEWRKSDSSITGIPSGFPKLDRATRGWQPNDLIILAARPSVGKTALALHLIDAAANSGTGKTAVAIWSLEMDAESLALRMLAAKSEMILHRIQTGRLDDDQMALLYKDGVEKLAKQKIFFDDASGLNMYSLRAKARRLKKKHDIKLIVVDYLQLVSDDSAKNREQEISKISRDLKRLAKELQVPVIALSQLSREVEKRTGSKRMPMLSDLRESGAIEQDADVVIFLWAPEEDEIKQDASLTNRRYARIAKQRNGMLTKVQLEFKNEIQVFREFDENAASSPNSKVPSGNFRPITDKDLF